MRLSRRTILSWASAMGTIKVSDGAYASHEISRSHSRQSSVKINPAARSDQDPLFIRSLALPATGFGEPGTEILLCCEALGRERNGPRAANTGRSDTVDLRTASQQRAPLRTGTRRGRDDDFSSPPAQIPASGTTAPGSCLGS